MKGEISTIELVAALIALFLAFNIFFSFQFSKTSKDLISMKIFGNDLLTSLDRNGTLYYNVYSDHLVGKSIASVNSLLDLLSGGKLRSVTKTSGNIPVYIPIFCNCTDEQVEFLRKTLGKTIINEREISIAFEKISLEKSLKILYYSKVLIIWNNMDLSNYESFLKKYLSLGGGIIKISDITSQPDSTTEEIFGITYSNLNLPSEGNVSFNIPNSVYDSNYLAYKYFFHVPIRINGSYYGPIPVEGGIQECASDYSNYSANFSFRDKSYRFWICTPEEVYWDTDFNEIADTIIQKREKFSLDECNFTISYITPESIYITFKDDYNFTKEIVDSSRAQIIGSSLDRIVLQFEKYPNGQPVPVMVINSSSGKAVWLVDIGRDGVSNIKDDERALLLSAILSAVNTKDEIKSAEISLKRIDVVNQDMFEPYLILFGLSHFI